VEGAEAAALLGQAVYAYRQALTVYTREQFPQQWATTQNNLANALRDQAARVKGAEAVGFLVDQIEAVALLDQAVAAYHQALTVYTRERFPQDWAMTQNNLANALRDLDRLKGNH